MNVIIFIVNNIKEGGDYLFNIGQKIVYPLQGIGTIEDIEEKEFSGEAQHYYKIRMLHNNTDISRPTNRTEQLHIRPLSDATTLDTILNECTHHKHNGISNRNLRARERINANTEKIKSGNLKDCIEVVHDLTIMNKEKPLNLNEKQLLRKAHTALVDEISLVKQLSVEEANNVLNQSIC